MKKLSMLLMAFVMVFVGALFLGTDSKVQANTSTTTVLNTGAVVLGTSQLNANTIGEDVVPVPSVATYQDYLFAGWFTDDACSLETAVTDKSKVTLTDCYAKFVPADTLNVKVQISKNTITDTANEVKEKRVIRFISSVESLELSQVGFIINGINGDKPCYTNTVYKRIDSSLSDELDYEFSPKVVGTKSEYFVTAKLPVATDAASLAKTYTATACWQTLDGTVVTGATRCISVNDRADNIINFTVNDTLTLGSATASFTSGSITQDAVEKVTVLETSNGCSNVRIELNEDASVVNMQSATSITITDSESKTATGVYRNYYTTYANGGADTSWYDVNTGAAEFVIASDADMWGLANLVSGNKNGLFENDKVILIRDVTLVKGKVQAATDTTEASWGYTTEGDDTTWPGIGTSNYHYKGSFDGDGNVISGVYMDVATQGTGLFNYVSKNTAIIEDFVIKNSYIENTKTRTGAVAGFFAGNLDNVYVDTDVVVNGNGQTGGLIGYFEYARTIKNCWFAGYVSNSSEGQSVGGIVGVVYRNAIRTIEDCLVTGTVATEKETESYAGGILGYAWDGETYVKNCISQATFDTVDEDYVGAVIGCVNSNKIAHIENVYSDSELLMTKKDTTAVATGKQNVFSETEYQGNAIKSETALDFVTTENPDGVWAATAEGPELAAFTTKEVLKDVVTRTVTKEWYYNAWTQDGGGDTYELATTTDLYGFAEIGTNVENFAKDTVKLAGNIDMNPGWTPTVNASGALTNVTESVKIWTPIGGTYQFNGVFDGQGNTIRGLYLNASGDYAGFFGKTGGTAQVKNLVFEDSYFKSSKSYLGVIAGGFYGTLAENVKIDESVTVNGTGNIGGIGGIVGSGNDTVIRNFKGCWIGCNIYATTQNIGGIIGRIWGGDTTIVNCLVTSQFKNTGNNNGTYSGSRLGSFVGANDNSGDNDLTIEDCLSIASITVKNNGLVGDVVGRILDNRADDNVVLNTYADTTRNSDYAYNSTITGNSSLDATYEFNSEDFTTKDASEVVPNLFTDPETNEAKTGWIKVEGSYPVPEYWQ